MPFDSQGTFTRLHNWEDDRINDIEITTDHHDEEDDNFAQGLSATFLKDGRVAMEGNINMAQFQIKNIAPATQESDAVNKKQLDHLEETLKQEIISSIPQKEEEKTPFFNESFLTNCLIEAPQGVAFLSENQIVIPKNIKVFIPNGLDENNRLKNIVFQLEKDLVVNVDSGENLSLILLNDHTAGAHVYLGESDDFPLFKKAGEYFYHKKQNYMYRSAGAGHWERKQAVVIGKNITVSGSTIISFQAFAPVRLLTENNQNLLTNIIAPNYASPQAVENNFRAPVSGWIYGTLKGSDQVTNRVFVNSQEVLLAYREHIDTTPVTLFLGQGDIFSFSGGQVNCVFYPCKGAY